MGGEAGQGLELEAVVGHAVVVLAQQHDVPVCGPGHEVGRGKDAVVLPPLARCQAALIIRVGVGNGEEQKQSQQRA
ncbi:hypothetical protein [Vreelandella jeotgali]|uniref:hypothetical protein n=1 Tax=Vreelandella jeotgali TaxID=553386 RepID=UPI00037FA098|nr:hypothetical protein [Halomonas jeotgali]